MKKIFLTGLIGLTVLTLVACGSSNDSDSKNSSTAESKVTASSESKKEVEGDFVETAKDTTFDGTILKGNSFSIKITDHRVIQPGEAGNEYGDKPVLAFWYDTLVSPDYKEEPAINPSTAWISNFQAVQDNDPNMVNELNISSLPDSQFLSSQMAEIKPGGTVPNAVAYELSDTETPVTLIAANILGDEYGRADFPIK